jgi:hypothetical protein
MVGTWDTYNSCDRVEVSHTAMSRQTASIEAPNISQSKVVLPSWSQNWPTRGGGCRGPVLEPLEGHVDVQGDDDWRQWRERERATHSHSSHGRRG